MTDKTIDIKVMPESQGGWGEKGQFFRAYNVPVNNKIKYVGQVDFGDSWGNFMIGMNS